MVSEEVCNGVMRAVRAMKKLDSGESINPGSPEHEALVWAVVKLLEDNLFDNTPLSGKDLEHAQEVIAKFKADKGIKD
jgi:hypothetical protein